MPHATTATPMPDAAFAAVADGIRRRILTGLQGGEQGAGTIAGGFDVSWPAISRHLRILKEAGLVTERREGRERRYTLNREQLRRSLGGWLAGFDAMWDENLTALKRHVEARTKTKRPRRKPR